MYEKILHKLKEQRGTNTQVTDRTLEAKARGLEVFITDDTALEKLDATADIAEMAGNISHISSEAVKNAKPAEPTPPVTKPVEMPPKKDDKTPEWAQSLIDSNKALTDKVLALESGNTGKTRSEKLSTALADAHPLFKDSINKSFSRVTFADDADFDAYLAEVNTDKAAFAQTAKENGLPNIAPKAADVKDDTELSKEMAETIKNMVTATDESKKPY